MTGPQDDRTGKEAGISPAPHGLVRQPLDFLAAEHQRQRQGADLLALAADGRCDAADIDSLIDFLGAGFGAHAADIESALFPILRRRCRDEDAIDALIALIAEERKDDDALTAKVADILLDLKSRGALRVGDRDRMRRLAARLRRRLAIEGGILMPIARVRLDEAALSALADALEERRGAR